MVKMATPLSSLASAEAHGRIRKGPLQMSTKPDKPLSGIRVLDLTHMLSGPYGAMLLADLGAETIKVEPLEGEGTRKWLADDADRGLDGMGAYFLTLNRNKQSIALDLKQEEGIAVFYDLVRVSDVVISNFGMGVLERLGIDHGKLSEINPKIVTCSISGYGSDGPDCERSSFDLVAQAAGGGMSFTGSESGQPVRWGVPIGDLGGGMFAALGIMAALLERQSSGVGQHVDISMLDCQVSLLNYIATLYFLTGQDPIPLGNAHSVHVPYNSYRTKDGFIVIAILTDAHWERLKKTLNVPGLEDVKYDTQPGRLAGRETIDRCLGALLETNDSAYWLEKLQSRRIPCGPVNRLSEALTDPQVLHRNMIVDLKHPNGRMARGPGNPVKLSRTKEEAYSAAPLVGQDTDTVLKGLLGYDDANIERLKQQSVVS